MEDVFPIYETLWRRAQSEDVWVHYYETSHDGESGYFHAREEMNLNPMIAVIRPYYIEPMEEPRRESNAPVDQPQPDIPAELVTLAHEYGHFRSYKGRTQRDEWLLYYAVAHQVSDTEQLLRDEIEEGLPADAAQNWFRRELGRRLGSEACGRIVREETLAWEVGRKVLNELGLIDFTLFDSAREPASTTTATDSASSTSRKCDEPLVGARARDSLAPQWT